MESNFQYRVEENTDHRGLKKNLFTSSVKARTKKAWGDWGPLNRDIRRRSHLQNFSTFQ